MINKKYLNDFILILSGFIVFSPITSHLSLNILHLPIALPELFFIPFYFYYKHIFDLRINLRVFLIGTFIILILLSIALLVGEYPIYSILSTTRGYVYMLLVYSVFKDKKLDNIDYIFYISLGSTIGWMVLGLSQANKIISNIQFEDTSLAVYGNMIALALCIAIPIIYKKTSFIYIVLFITLIISFTVGLRRQIAVAFSTFVFSFLFQIKFNIKRLLRISITIALISLILVRIIPIARQFTQEISPTLYVRIFVKTEQLISGNISGSDQHRISSFNNFLNDIEDYIFPHGFVSKRTTVDAGTGLFMDSPYIELFYTFGIIFSLFIIVIFCLNIVFHYKNYIFNNVRESLLSFIMGAVIIILMMIEGSFLNFVFTTPLTGFVLARLFSRKNLIK